MWLAVLIPCLVDGFMLPVFPHRAPLRSAARIALAEGATEVNYAELGTGAIDNFLQMLGEDQEPPMVLRTLKSAVESGEKAAIQAAMYEMLIVQAIEFQLSDEGKLVPSELDFTDLSVDEQAKKETMRYVYSCTVAKPKLSVRCQAALLQHLPCGLQMD